MKFVYLFDEGNAGMKALLGGKGANLAEMTNIGLPVPFGFTITTEACNKYYDDGEKIDPSIIEQMTAAMKELEKRGEKQFGDKSNPLLVSVRSGAPVSMPGMMDTILNLGLNDDTVVGMAEATSNPRFAYDSYRRFIQMFSNVVMDIDMPLFEGALEAKREKAGVENDSELSAEYLIELVDEYKAIYRKEIGEDFPQKPEDQLLKSVTAVFRSWNNPRAISYRFLNEIPHELGTAVNVQMMVFGNMGDDCGTGVAFTRSPSTGENKLFGEFLMNAQGEDVVAGIRTPKHISELQRDMPDAYEKLADIAERLETHYKDMQDLEFTIERGKLFMLQTRSGKRTTDAALQIAVEMVDEKMISREDALMMIEAKQINSVLHPNFDQKALDEATPIAVGLPASPGAASGMVYFHAKDAAEAGARGEDVILVRQETSPEDIEGMAAAKGILTARGGMTSHAAVVARGMGRCCVAGCGDIIVDEHKRVFRTKENREYHEGDWISLNGSTGRVYGDKLATTEARISGNFATIMDWADEVRTLKIRTNADSPKDASKAREFGAEGIGLCRTEHMFFSEERIMSVRKMIISETEKQRKAALEEILPMQKQDFKEIFIAMGGLPVTIRLLDPPLHEFLPQEDGDIKKLAEAMGLTFDKLKGTVEQLHEFNPMLGHRGCRLAVTYPEIPKMQTTAIIEAALEVNKEKGLNVVPEIMVPLICDTKELSFVKKVIVETADKIIADSGEKLTYQVGTMIEVPRACVTANQIAAEAEFFSFGTNDLTQMTYGFSRDDAGKFLNDYYEFRIFETDPFARVDADGVGQLMRMAVEKGRKTRPDIKLGICGEHGGDPFSIQLCYDMGLDYVSCSPFRVPVAKLAAAQSTIRRKNDK